MVSLYQVFYFLKSSFGSLYSFRNNGSVKKVEQYN